MLILRFFVGIVFMLMSFGAGALAYVLSQSAHDPMVNVFALGPTSLETVYVTVAIVFLVASLFTLPIGSLAPPKPEDK